MTLTAERIDPPVQDPVSNVLKWVLLVVAILTFALLAWATTATYRLAPPQPDRFVGADGAVLMTNDDIVAGKGGFQKADLMDYGSLYGMGSYYGEDYTASTLVRLGAAARDNVVLAANANPSPASRRTSRPRRPRSCSTICRALILRRPRSCCRRPWRPPSSVFAMISPSRCTSPTRRPAGRRPTA